MRVGQPRGRWQEQHPRQREQPGRSPEVGGRAAGSQWASAGLAGQAGPAGGLQLCFSLKSSRQGPRNADDDSRLKVPGQWSAAGGPVRPGSWGCVAWARVLGVQTGGSGLAGPHYWAEASRPGQSHTGDGTPQGQPQRLPLPHPAPRVREGNDHPWPSAWPGGQCEAHCLRLELGGPGPPGSPRQCPLSHFPQIQRSSEEPGEQTRQLRQDEGAGGCPAGSAAVRAARPS